MRVDEVEVPKDVVQTRNAMYRAGKADGRLHSCIRCHESAPFDGLYGLSRSGVPGR